ncbi:MAG: hypothetical protein AMXMBFR48_19420 [Ignavibacteriales bacterium]
MSTVIISDADFGKKRKVQEDSHFYAKVADVSLPYEYVMMVADGMGGHEAGDIASGLARDILKELFADGKYKAFARQEGIREDPESLQFFKSVVREAFRFVHKEIKRKAGGTTCTLALIFKAAEGSDFRPVIIGHVGDSRAYKLSKKSIDQITDDDSIVWQLYKAGKISKDKMNTHKERNVVTQALGGEVVDDIHIYAVKLYKQETLFLCSDGLHGLVSDKKIWGIHQHASSLEELRGNLINAANNLGGKDNISVALFSEGFKKQSSFTKLLLPGSAVLLILLASVIGYIYLGEGHEPASKGVSDKLDLDPEINQTAGNGTIEKGPEISIETIDLGKKRRFTLKINVLSKSVTSNNITGFSLQFKENSNVYPAKTIAESGFKIDSSGGVISLIREYEYKGIDYWDFEAILIAPDGLAGVPKPYTHENPNREKITDYVDKNSVKKGRQDVTFTLIKGSFNDIEVDGFKGLQIKNTKKVTVTNAAGSNVLRIKLKKERTWTTFTIK